MKMNNMPVKVTKASHPEIVRLAQAAFPTYRGRTIHLSSTTPQQLDSYWDGGSRDYYVFIRIADHKALEVEANHPFFCPDKPRTLRNGLPAGIALVRHCYCCGQDCGLTVYLPKPQHTTELPSCDVSERKAEREADAAEQIYVEQKAGWAR